MQQRTLRLSPSDLDALARIVHAEAGNQPANGKIAVAFTVLNRMASSGGQFPNSVTGVIEQRNQFEPMIGKQSAFDLPGAPPETQSLVTQALAAYASGQLPDPTNGATFFQNVAVTNARGTNFAASEPVAQIGDHSFYNRYKLNPQVKIDPYVLEVDGVQGASAAPGGAAGGRVVTDSPASSAPPSAVAHPGNPLFAFARALGVDTPNQYIAQPQGAQPSAPLSQNPFYSAMAGQNPPTQGQYGLKPGHDGVNLDGVDPQVLAAANAAANAYGGDLVANSGFRSQDRQDAIRAQGDPNRPTVAKNSHHTSGTGLDLSTRGMSMEQQARLVDALAGAGFTGIGHYDSHIHADFRDAVPSSFGTRPNWSGWTNMPEPLMEVLKARGFAGGAAASSIRRGF